MRLGELNVAAAKMLLGRHEILFSACSHHNLPHAHVVLDDVLMLEPERAYSRMVDSHAVGTSDALEKASLSHL